VHVFPWEPVDSDQRIEAAIRSSKRNAPRVHVRVLTCRYAVATGQVIEQRLLLGSTAFTG
jgi:hypothetical protein